MWEARDLSTPTFILDDAANDPFYCVLIHVIVLSWRREEVGKEVGNE